MQTLHEFEEKFHVPLIEGYGLSEASPVVSKNPLRGAHKAGSIGIPIANVEMSVQDNAGRMLGTGETGEICVRGGNVMMGYWNQPEETKKVFRNGWLLTGDVGHRDADGYYYITDRKKDMLIVNGINVYPREIEEVLYHFPGVSEAAVIGVPDARRGEQPVAFVSPAEGHTLDEKALLQFIRGQLADFKIPRQMIILPALPKNATGKILAEAYRRALECDPVSAFGGVIGVNRAVDAETAGEMAKLFLEVIAAPGFSEEARKIFSSKKNLRLVEVAGVQQRWVLKNVSGGVLLQDNDVHQLQAEDLKVVTRRQPSDEEMRALLFAWKICKHVKSNAILYARDGQKRGRGRRPDEPRRLGEDRRHEGRAAAQGNGCGLRCVLSLPRWRGGNSESRLDGNHPARGFGARQGSDRSG